MFLHNPGDFILIEGSWILYKHPTWVMAHVFHHHIDKKPVPIIDPKLPELILYNNLQAVITTCVTCNEKVPEQFIVLRELINVP